LFCELSEPTFILLPFLAAARFAQQNKTDPHRYRMSQ
jgi:hypothetical protein